MLICAAIALLSCAGVLAGPAVKGTLIATAVGALVIMLRIDREAIAPLLPSDAFSLRSPTGAGLWMVLLLSVAYTPLAIYVPLFSAATARARASPRRVHRGWSIAGVDGCGAYGGHARRRMADG